LQIKIANKVATCVRVIGFPQNAVAQFRRLATCPPRV
jgi:hypothetical protein